MNKKDNKKENKKENSINLIFYKIDIQNLQIENIKNNNLFTIIKKINEPNLFSFYFLNYFYKLKNQEQFKKILNLLAWDTFNFYMNYKSLLKNEFKYQENNNYKNIIEYLKKKKNNFNPDEFFNDFEKLLYQKNNNKINNISNNHPILFNSKEKNKEIYTNINKKNTEERTKKNKLSINSFNINFKLNNNDYNKKIKKSKSFINKSCKFYFENILTDNKNFNDEFLVNLYKRLTISQEQNNKFFKKFLFNPKNYLI